MPGRQPEAQYRKEWHTEDFPRAIRRTFYFRDAPIKPTRTQRNSFLCARMPLSHLAYRPVVATRGHGGGSQKRVKIMGFKETAANAAIGAVAGVGFVQGLGEVPDSNSGQLADSQGTSQSYQLDTSIGEFRGDNEVGNSGR